MDLSTVPHWLELSALIITALVFAATVLVRVADIMISIAPNSIDPAHIQKAKAVVNTAGEWLAKAMHYFPTFFKNPKTQQMEKLIEQLRAEKELPSLPVGSSTVEVKVDDKAS